MSLHLPTAPVGGLPSLIDRAAASLTSARTSAEILEARDVARDAYDAAKKAARLSKAKGAHDTLIAAAHRAQADALEIEAQAKRRLADEYDAARSAAKSQPAVRKLFQVGILLRQLRRLVFPQRKSTTRVLSATRKQPTLASCAAYSTTSWSVARSQPEQPSARLWLMPQCAA